MHQNKAGKNSQGNRDLSEAIARHENLVREAVESGDTLAANRNRFMAAVYRSMLDHP